jgi:hypothetical protein
MGYETSSGAESQGHRCLAVPAYCRLEKIGTALGMLRESGWRSTKMDQEISHKDHRSKVAVLKVGFDTLSAMVSMGVTVLKDLSMEKGSPSPIKTTLVSLDSSSGA